MIDKRFERFANDLEKIEVIFKADNINIIHPADFYEEEYIGPEIIEVSDDVLYELLCNRKSDKNYDRNNPRRNAVKIHIENEGFMATIGGFEASSVQRTDLRIWLKKNLKGLRKVTVNRAILYFIDGYTVEDISRIENVNRSSVYRSINKAKDKLAKINNFELN